MIKCFDLVQRLQQAPGEQADPQHTGRVDSQLEAIHLGVQVRGGNWKKGKCVEYSVTIIIIIIRIDDDVTGSRI